LPIAGQFALHGGAAPATEYSSPVPSELVSTGQPTSESDVALARATGFAECAIALRRALASTPLGWLPAVWFCRDRVAIHSILLWLGSAALICGCLDARPGNPATLVCSKRALALQGQIDYIV
jgi:hypothetical protein